VKCGLEYATRVRSLNTSLESRNTSVACCILVLAASSKASWRCCQHYFHYGGTCEHLGTEDESLMSLLLLLAPSPVQLGYALSHVLTESHHRCDGRQSFCMPSRRRLKILEKGEEWLHDQNRGAEKRKVATTV
jgi:hypothetical protein